MKQDDHQEPYHYGNEINFIATYGNPERQPATLVYKIYLQNGQNSYTLVKIACIQYINRI